MLAFFLSANLFGKSIAYIKEVVDKELAVSRIFRNSEYILAADDEVIRQGDVIYGVSAQPAYITQITKGKLKQHLRHFVRAISSTCISRHRTKLVMKAM